jgi:hypothetical protein
MKKKVNYFYENRERKQCEITEIEGVCSTCSSIKHLKTITTINIIAHATVFYFNVQLHKYTHAHGMRMISTSISLHTQWLKQLYITSHT